MGRPSCKLAGNLCMQVTQWLMHKGCAYLSAADPLHPWLFKSAIDCNSRQESNDGKSSASWEWDMAASDQS